MAASLFDIDIASLSFDQQLMSGDDVLDREHRQLLEAARELLAASSSGKPGRDIQAMMDALVAALSVHFAHEEHIMREAGWSETERHAGIHGLLMVEANRLLDRHRANVVSFLDIYRFIVGTLVRDHLAIHDVEFHHYLQEHQGN